MRSIRRFSQLLLTICGGSIVVYAMYNVEASRERVLYTVLGLLIMELGIWQITAFLFPNERSNKPLRKETDYFLKLVRRLNRAALAADRGSKNAEAELERVREEMLHSVERMQLLAGANERTIKAKERKNAPHAARTDASFPRSLLPSFFRSSTSRASS